jgi:hypothetical protein
VHAQPKILEEPVVFLSIDTPRRDPKDIVEAVLIILLWGGDGYRSLLAVAENLE